MDTSNKFRFNYDHTLSRALLVGELQQSQGMSLKYKDEKNFSNHNILSTNLNKSIGNVPVKTPTRKKNITTKNSNFEIDTSFKAGEGTAGYIVSIKYSKIDLNISENPTIMRIFNMRDFFDSMYSRINFSINNILRFSYWSSIVKSLGRNVKMTPSSETKLTKLVKITLLKKDN